MKTLNMTPDEKIEANFLERVFGITTKDILEVSEAIENDDFTGFDFSKIISGDEFRASCKEEYQIVSFKYPVSQVKRLDEKAHKRNLNRSQYLTFLADKDLAISAN